VLSPGRKKCSDADILQERFGQLSAEGKQALLDYAEFLLDKYGEAPDETLPEPEPIPRPDDESVVKAIKRLSSSYFMVDRSSILHETSALMAEHVMQGRAAVEVIDELEVLFERQYKKLQEKQ
jgi:hypothetical protein